MSTDETIKELKPDGQGRVSLANVAHVVNLDPVTIRRRVAKGTFPPPLPGLTRVMWMLADILTYLEHFGPRPWIPWKPPL